MKNSNVNFHKILIFVITFLLLASFAIFLSINERVIAENSLDQTCDAYFFEMGYDADACVIDIGDTEILVDFGCKHNKTNNKVENCPLIAKMNETCTDGVWEYIIVTHGDADHIRGAKHVFDFLKDKQIEHIIEFDQQSLWDTKIYRQYDSLVKEAIGQNQKIRSKASDWLKNTDGNFGEDLSGAKLTILNNKLSVNTTIKNQVSVCFLLEYGESKLLFTGDLQETQRDNSNTVGQGETNLWNEEKDIISGVTFYKAAHHGSSTSSSKNFMNGIKPKYVYVPSVMDGTGNHGLSLKTLENIFEANESAEVFVPEEILNGEKISYNGNVKFSFKTDGTCYVKCDTEKSPITKDNYKSEWERFESEKLEVVAMDAKVPNGRDHCTLIKYKDIEVLIDCGIGSEYPYLIENTDFVDKIGQYCTDDILEYVVVTNSQTESLSSLIGTYRKGKPLNDGVFSIFEIENIIDFETTNIVNPVKNSWLFNYMSQKSELIANGTKDIPANKTMEIVLYEDDSVKLAMTILPSNTTMSNNENNYSIGALITFNDAKILFTGDLTNENGGETALVDAYGELIRDVTIYQAGCDAYKTACSKKFMNYISPDYIVISAPLNSMSHGFAYGTEEKLGELFEITEKIYAKSIMIGNEERELCGDIIFSIDESGNVLEPATKVK